MRVNETGTGKGQYLCNYEIYMHVHFNLHFKMSEKETRSETCSKSTIASEEWLEILLRLSRNRNEYKERLKSLGF